MKAAILHGIASLKLHNLVFITLAKSSNCSPGSRVRFEALAERYANMALHIEGNDKTGLALDDLSATPSDLPALEDISRMVDWGDYQGEGQLTWALCLTNDKFEDMPNTRIARKTLWEFYTAISRHYPDGPRGIIAWATFAHKGDAAVFYQAKTNRTFHLTLD